ncbi:MAG: hypothetical protein AB8G22_22540 [Saprospiraceae bacterium]
MLFGLMGLGLLCLAITFFGVDALHTRFWTNYLHNTVFFTGISFMAGFLLLGFSLSYSGFHITFKRVWEAYSQFLIVGFLLMIPLVAGVWGHFHHLYHWADAESVANDEILQGKSGFLNPMWYTLSVAFVAIWYLFIRRFRMLSIDEDKNGTADFAHYKKMKFTAAIFLPIAAFSSAAAIWQWMMSIDAHWYSTMYAWYTSASWFVSMIAMTILLIMFMKAQGYMEYITQEHMHDLGKYLFAFSIFWTYLWFSQYMLIWYANVGEETVYFQHRIQEYPVLFYGNLVMNFVLPFLILLRNSTKRKFGTLGFIAILCLFGHWWDFFYMIKPGALHTAHEVLGHAGHAAADAAAHGAEHAEHASHFVSGFTLPGFLEIGTFLGFLALFVFLAMNQLTKASLLPKNDPYLAESLHHHV